MLFLILFFLEKTNLSSSKYEIYKITCTKPLFSSLRWPKNHAEVDPSKWDHPSQNPMKFLDRDSHILMIFLTETTRICSFFKKCACQRRLWSRTSSPKKHIWDRQFSSFLRNVLASDAFGCWLPRRKHIWDRQSRSFWRNLLASDVF